MNDATFLIIGGGPAAARAVEALRAAGVDDRVVIIGEETRPPYQRPELSKGYLAGTTKPDQLDVLAADWYADHDVELVTGRTVTTLQTQPRLVKLDDGDRIGYDRLLIATGSSVRALPVPGADLAGVFTLRRVGDSDEIAAAIAAGGPLVVVGGGWIGLEVAAVARTAGLEVTLLESAASPLAGVLGEQVGAQFTALHEEHGVVVRTGVQVQEIVGTDRVEGVRLADGTLLPAAAVVTGIGIVPRTELAEAAGLAVDDGVLVDDGLRTADERIWAAGDVANAQNGWAGRRLRVAHYANAEDQGRFAGQAMAGASDHWSVPPFFWSDQYDAGLEYRGWADPESPVVLRGTPPDGPWFAFWLDAGRVVAGLHVNGWDQADEVKALVTDRAAVDLDQLADPGRPLAEVRRVGSPG